MDLSKFSVLKEKKRNEYKWHSRKDRWILREVHFNKKCFKTDEESVRLMSISNCKPSKQLLYVAYYLSNSNGTYFSISIHFSCGLKIISKMDPQQHFFSKSPLTKFVTMAWARIWTWSEPPWLHCQLGRWRHQ